MTSRDVDFLERDSLDRPLSDVSSTTYMYHIGTCTIHECTSYGAYVN